MEIWRVSTMNKGKHQREFTLFIFYRALTYFVLQAYRFGD